MFSFLTIHIFVVLDLRTKAAFVSASEKERVETAERSAKRAKHTYFEALRRSNRPGQIMLSPLMRRMVEEALGLKQTGSKVLDEDEDDSFETRIAEIYSDFDSENMEFVPLLDGPTSAEQLDLVRKLVDYLFKTGFSPAAIISCLEAITIGERNSEVLKRFERLESYEKSSPSDLFLVLRDVSLQYMCLNIDEEDLPKGFDPSVSEMKTGFKVHVPKNSLVSKYSVEHVGLANEIETYGWDKEVCLLAISKAKNIITENFPDHFHTNICLLYVSTVYLLVKCTSVQQSCVESRSNRGCLSAIKQAKFSLIEYIKKCIDFIPDPEPADCAVSFRVQEEIETLEAIFGASFSINSFGSFVKAFNTSFSEVSRLFGYKVIKIDLSYVPDCQLLVFLQSTGLYPEISPLCLLKGTVSSRLHEIQVQLNRKAEELKGEPQIFHLHSYVEELIGNLRKEPTEKYIAAYNKELKNLIESLDLDIGNEDDDVQEDQLMVGEVEEDEVLTDIESQSTASFSKPSSKARVDFWTSTNLRKLSSLASPPEMMKSREKLPAWASKTAFIDMITSNRAVVVTGETGCGKTTQIPQFIFEADSQAKIIVCQPRRLAAVGVASRVAEEMGCQIGETVGYMVRGEAKVAANTRIAFCK